MHTVNIGNREDESTIAQFFQKQSHLYSITLKDMAIACIRTHSGDPSICSDSVNFNSYFFGQYIVSVLDKIIVDTLVSSPSLLSTHNLNYTRRFIIEFRN